MGTIGEAATAERIGRYRLIGEIGRGAMGRVYVAHDPNLERRVALKVMSAPEGEDDEEVHELRQRLLLEARAAGRLSHPGIVAVHDADTDPDTGLSYLAMELVEGESLEALLRREGRLAPALAVDIAAKVARALGYAHTRGVVHRDVKPANILLAEDGRVKVADFGIAKIGSLAVTRAGLVIGSPYFMSPEQVQGQPVDGRSDLFSLGGVLYRCLTGELPFPGDGVVTVAFKVVHVDPRPASGDQDLPPALLDLLRRALAKEPQDRFPTGEEMAAALEQVAAELGGSPPPSPPPMTEPATLPPARPAHPEQTLVLERETNAFPLPIAPSDGARRARLPAWSTWTGGALVLAALLVLAAIFAGDRNLPALAPGGKLPAAIAGGGGPGAQPAESPLGTAGETERPAPAVDPPAQPAADGDGRGAARQVAPAPPLDATLEIVYRNRLGSATVAVTVDGEAVWTRSVAAPRHWARIVGDSEWGAVPIASGERTIGVAVQGHSMAVQASSSISGRFAPGESRRLRIALNPYRERIRLEWVEP